MSLIPRPLPPYVTSLDSVPKGIQAQLEIIRELVLVNIKNHVDMIWLFGSYARGDAINDRRVDPETGLISEYNSDVDILVIVRGKNTMQKEKWWRRLDKAIADHPSISSSIHLIRDSIYRVEDALRHSEYFYLDVVREGIVLYGDDKELPEPREFPIEKRREFAIEYLNRFFQRADASKRSLEVHYQVDDKPSAMYCLHQLSERLFYSYLLVFTHYKPRSHKLFDMRARVATINKNIKSIFPIGTKTEEHRFQFLNDAYVDARYKDNYEVDPEVLEHLIQRVAEFQKWVRNECLTMIDNFIPGQNFSADYEQPGELLDLEILKTQKIPLTVIYEQKEAMKLMISERDVERGESLAREESERAEKDAALQRERESILREREERNEKERLLQKLRDAGLEP